MIKFIKTRNVQSPFRDPNENAGIDFFIPEKSSFTEDELKAFGNGVTFNGNSIFIAPQHDIKIPSGIKSKFDKNLALVAFNKSGIATKTQLAVGACIIDSSYQGEYHIHLINWSDRITRLEFGQKVVQFVPTVISIEDHEVLAESEAEFFLEETSRGSGGFGSTGV